ncbi:MAG: aldehyde dehydrogenase family protein [Chloroflexota bacterium]|nr:aldehyde dehydrogenase family protein [Chloroflexota bacterium]
MAETFRNYIGGEWRAAVKGATFESLNPAHTGEVIGVFQRSTAEDVALAVEAAASAQRAWREVPVPERGEMLYTVARLMEERKEELAQLMTREMGKVIKEARGDVQEGIDMAKYIAGEGRRYFGQTVPSELRDKFCMTVRQPIGVVGLITPWNFPIAIPCWKMMPALLCGNAVVLKPAEDTPACATRLVEIFIEAGYPKGVINLVTGYGEEAGQPLLAHPGVAAISFTGSSDVGRFIAATCGQNLKRVSLELGGKNAIVVMDDADLELVIDGAIWGGFGTAGQRCTASSRLIVEKSVVREVEERLVARAEALKIGDGLRPEVEVGPVVNSDQLRRVDSYTAIGRDEGARLLTGGRVLTEEGLGDGYFYAPTVFGSVEPHMRVAQEEIFGPTVSVIPVDSFDRAIEVANGTQYGLSLAIYTRDVNRAFRAINRLEAGIVYVNAPTIGAEIQLPFGGIKGTGNGHREAGSTAIDQFSEIKSVFVDYSGHLQRAQIDNRE